MSNRSSVLCQIEGLRSRYEYDDISFDTGSDLSVVLNGEAGRKGISATAADLIDFAAAIFEIERQLKRKSTSPPEKIKLRMRLRNPEAWDDRAIIAAQDILGLLGDAVWELDFRAGLKAPIPEHQKSSSNEYKQVALLSGGMDSACGIATLKDATKQTRLVSFYTRQKSLQGRIASDLGYEALSQWRLKWTGNAGPGHSFFYRSFLFLSLGAAIAHSWKCQTIYQFENGVLATAIPPSPAWLMTKHAHPLLHQSAGRLFSALFGGDWDIRNPFLSLTKRGCVQEAIKSVGRSRAAAILKQTETCWFHWSNRVIGGSKEPGVPCGICIPCIIRRTAFSDETYAFDLLRDVIKNDERKGMNFRAYFGFLDRVAKTRRSPGGFYALLPPAGRELAGIGGPLSLKDLHELFLTFGKEFKNTYELS